MKRWLFLVLASLTFLAACKGPPPVAWPDVVKCSSNVDDAVGKVGQVLLKDGLTDSGAPAPLSKSSKRELAELGARYSADVVACLVGRWIDRWSSPGAARDPVIAAAEARGRAFLEEVGTDVRAPPDGW